MKKVIRLTESDLARIVKRVIMEGKTPSYEEYKKVFNSVIKPWMDGMQQKWTSQGYSCKHYGDDNCDNNIYGFRRLGNDFYYYFPYEVGMNLALYNTDAGTYFSVWLRDYRGGTRQDYGKFGLGAKNIEEVQKAANDAIAVFNKNASSAFSSTYPR